MEDSEPPSTPIRTAPAPHFAIIVPAGPIVTSPQPGMQAATLDLDANVVLQPAGMMIVTGATILDGTIVANAAGITLQTVTGTGILDAATNLAPVTIFGDLGTSGGAALAQYNEGPITSGDWNVTTFNLSGAGVVSFDRTGIVEAETFDNLDISTAGTITSGGAWVVNNALTLNPGVWDPSTFTRVIAGNWDDTAISFSPASGAIRLTWWHRLSHRGAPTTSSHWRWTTAPAS